MGVVSFLTKTFFGINGPGEKIEAPVTTTLSYEIHVPEFARLRQSGQKYTLVDVREPVELERAKLDGSVNIPMGEITMRANQELDPESHIVVMCHHGVRSMSVTSFLRQQGFEKAQSLAGGIDRYAREIDPSVGTY
ncbi:MAG: rhodanese-like domain-containing protein [Acidobacteriaceae bacterium]